MMLVWFSTKDVSPEIQDLCSFYDLWKELRVLQIPYFKMSPQHLAALELKCPDIVTLYCSLQEDITCEDMEQFLGNTFCSVMLSGCGDVAQEELLELKQKYHKRLSW